MIAPAPSPRLASTEALPSALTSVPRWVLYRLVKRGDKLTKEPIGPAGYRIDVRKPSNWTTYERAVKAYEQGVGDGLGFVFCDDDDLLGVDLDHCVDDDGNLTPDALAIAAELDSYAELSPSGKGLHIIARGDIPTDIHPDGIGMFSHDRFFCVTGRHVGGTPSEPQRRPRQLQALHARYAAPKPSPEPIAPRAPLLVSIDDAVVIEQLSRDAKASDLWAGEWTGYTSQSEADLALCNKLRFYGGADAGRIDRLFRASGLYREKWERDDYRTETIEKALPGDVWQEYGRVYSSGRGAESELIEGITQPDDADLVTIKRCEYDRLLGCETRVSELERERSRIFAILRNPHIKSEKITALVTIFAVDSALRRRGAESIVDGESVKVTIGPARKKKGDSKDTPKPRPDYGLAYQAGQSRGTVSKNLDRLDDYGIIRKRNRDIWDPVQGQKIPSVWVELPAPVPELLDRLVTLDPGKPTTWGGIRRRCADHPDGIVAKTMATTWVCMDCGTVIHTAKRVEYEGPDGPMSQDDALPTCGTTIQTNSETGSPEPELTYVARCDIGVCIDCGRDRGMPSLGNRCPTCYGKVIIARDTLAPPLWPDVGDYGSAAGGAS